jgi:hypothetical protein
LYYIVIQGRERGGREGEGEGEGEREGEGEGKGKGKGEQAISKLIDLFIDRYGYERASF